MDTQITSIVNTPSAEVASKTFVAATYATIASLSNYALTSSLTSYWKNDGTSTATDDWNIGSYSLYATSFHTQSGLFFDSGSSNIGKLYWGGTHYNFENDGSPAGIHVLSVTCGSVKSTYNAVGINLSDFENKIFVSEADLYFDSNSYGPVLTDSNGDKWRIAVDTSGNLSTTSL